MALAIQALACPHQSLGAPAVALVCARPSFSLQAVKANLVIGASISKWRAMAYASSDFQSPFTAKELERDSAKEALLLAIEDAGGVDALTSGRQDAAARINVSEKLLVLERLNPTPRPTTSPLLEGLWEFKWAGARSPGTTAARTLAKRFPATIASLSSLNILILDGTTKATATVKLLGSVESSFVLSTKLTAEGPTRLKEEYVEGVVSSPNVSEVPSQLKSVYDQIVAAAERLPAAVKEAVSNGIKVPLSELRTFPFFNRTGANSISRGFEIHQYLLTDLLTCIAICIPLSDKRGNVFCGWENVAGSFERQLLISFLDEEILVARDESGVPDILYKLQPAVPVVETVTVVPEYYS